MEVKNIMEVQMAHLEEIPPNPSFLETLTSFLKTLHYIFVEVVITDGIL